MSLRTALLSSQRLIISCFLFRCANPLVKAYYATFRLLVRRQANFRIGRYLFTGVCYFTYALIVTTLRIRTPPDTYCFALTPCLDYTFPRVFAFGYQTAAFQINSTNFRGLKLVGESLLVPLLVSACNLPSASRPNLNCQKSMTLVF